MHHHIIHNHFYSLPQQEVVNNYLQHDFSHSVVLATIGNKHRPLLVVAGVKMSFYFDDDNDFLPTKKEEKQAEPGFVCNNCGGTESYMDASGALTCAECFTQSNVIDESQMEIDFEESLAMAGRSKSGPGFVTLKKSKQRKEQKRFDEYDNTVALPDVLDCLKGIQRVLREAGKIVCGLAGAKKHKIVLKTIRTIWTAYLRSWHDGSLYFGR